MSDEGFTHIALVCANADKTIEFYRRFADFTVIHDRRDSSGRVFWLSDLKRAFAIVFIEQAEAESPLGPLGHLGVCVKSRDEVDLRARTARTLGYDVSGPQDDGPPVGYWAFIADPDGHTLEISFGQEIQQHVERTRT
ncbi:MAG: bleomycin resistance protein [Sphingomonas sp.]|nr:bleomycin resistance protein [Sphingomonas sp.]